MNSDTYIQSCINGICSDIANCSTGERNSVLNKKAYRLFQAVGAGQVAEQLAVARLTEAAQAIDLTLQAVKDTLKSARRGIAAPKPFGNDEGIALTPEIRQRASAQQAEQDAQAQAKQLKSIEWLNGLKHNSAAGSPYLARKQLSDAHHLFFTGEDNKGAFTAHELFNKSGQSAGFERIYHDGSKMVSAGCGASGVYYGCFLSGQDDDSVCYVTEGAADAVSIMLSTGKDCYSATSATNIIKVAQLMKPEYKRVVVALDNDKAGLKVAEKLGGEFKCVMPEKEGADYSDIYCAGGIDEVNKQLMNEVTLRTDARSKHVPHTDADLISLCPDTSIARFSSELAETAKMPRNTTFLTVLSIFSSVACRVYRVNYEHGGSQPLSINFCGEQPPSAAKSQILKHSQMPVFQSVSSDRKAIIKELDAKKKQIEAASDKDEEKALKSELKAIEKKLNCLFEFITDTTPEALDMCLVNTNGYYSIASAEQGAINTLMGISYGDGKGGSNRDLVLKGWNGEWHNSKRKSRESYKGEVVGAITAIAQDGMIENLLKASDTSGVIERFVLWAESTLLGERDHMKYHKMNDEIASHYHRVMVALYKKIANSDYGDLPALSLSVRAWNRIKFRRNELEPTIANDGENANTLLRGLIGKYDIHVMKIAACLHLSNALEGNADLIHDDRVREAMAIVDSYILHLKSLIQESAIHAYSEREKAVLEHLKTKQGMKAISVINALSRRKCFTNGKKTRDAKAVKETIEQLCERDLLTITNKPSAAFADAIITMM
ncbi:DUF3987 domain-containing protein [Vibrio fluvialis]|nr:DUF3987 domain-containing protein [Vibrio fluvialis]